MNINSYSTITNGSSEPRIPFRSILKCLARGGLSVVETRHSDVKLNLAHLLIVLGSGDRVTTREIRRWNITNTDLVVLSACETAVGEAELGSGIEILGFGYQMQRAGAKSAIASLWSVSDGGTQVLMNAFYAALNSGMTKAEALRVAQTALITSNFAAVPGIRGDATITVMNTETGQPISSDQLDHPYYWAPFILIGNGL